MVRRLLASAAIIAWVLVPAHAQDAGGTADIITLQRLVFGLGEPSFPDTPEKRNAQLRLASAYAMGSAVTQDVQMACGLAESARHLASTMAGHDAGVQERATALRDEICANSRDWPDALGLALCPRFGIEPATLELGRGALLVVSRNGWTIEDRSGAHDGEWPLNCGDVVASMRLSRVAPPRGSRLAQRTFVELFVWHQSHRTDGGVGDRSLDWQLLEFSAAKGDLHQVDSAGVLVDPRASIWPTPPVPQAVAGGATFQMLRSGEVRWRFDAAPDLGIGVVPAP